MDKYEFSMKVDELKRLAANEQFRKAYKILESIDLKKIKNIKDIYVIVDILVENEKYEDAKEILIGISKKLKSRRVYHQLIDISIKCGQVEPAKRYMKEFRKIAPKDPYNYVFLYQIAGLLDEGMDQQIRILEDLKQYEYIEKWAYELAKVYHRAGRDEDCIAECGDLILWFGDGIYVEKAKLLKQYLTGEIKPNEIKSIAKGKGTAEVHNLYNQKPTKVDDDGQGSNLSTSDDDVTESGTDVKDQSEVEARETSEVVQLEHIWGRKEKGKGIYTVNEPDPVNDVSKASYQSAFEYIEDMELKEQEDELDRIIEATHQEAVVKKEVPLEENSVKEESTSSEDAATDDISTMNEPTIYKEDTIAASEQTVKDLVNETADSIAAQIGSLFDEDELARNQAGEVNESKEVTESEVQETVEVVAQEEAEKALQEVKSAEDQETEEPVEHVEEVKSAEDQETEEPVEHVEKVNMVELQEVDIDEEVAAGKLNGDIESVELEDAAQIEVQEQFKNLFQSKFSKDIKVCDYLGQFARMKRTSQDIIDSLENISDAHNNITFLIQGSSTFDQTYFARKLAKLLYTLGRLKSQKIVILEEKKFLQVDFTKHASQAQDSCIVVEQVTEITDRLTEQINTLHELGCIVCLEVISPAYDELIEPMEKQLQANTIRIIEFSVSDLVGFAEDYATEKEYQIDQDAKRYLKQYSEECLNEEGVDAFCKVLEKITNAYHCANRRNKVELRNIAELGNYEDAAFMSIRYTDFANEN